MQDVENLLAGWIPHIEFAASGVSMNREEMIQRGKDEFLMHTGARLLGMA